MIDVTQQFAVELAVTIRPCKERDLPGLEWFGMFTPHRELIRAAFERQQRGEVLMLVADINDFPAGQAWIDLTKKRDESVGVVWAVRVIPFLQNLRIGTRLIAAAERALVNHGFAYSELGVEKNNVDAKRLYERIGYSVVSEEQDEFSCGTPDGSLRQVPVEELILRKKLRRLSRTASSPNHTDISGEEQ